MKINRLLLAVSLVVGSLAFAGCKKSQPVAETMPAMALEGVQVQLPELLRQVTAAGNPSLQAVLQQVQMSLRYGQYDAALQGLSKISADPSFKDAQKKLAGEVVQQLTQVVAKAGPVRK